MRLSGRPNVAVMRRALGAFFRLGLIGAATIASQAGLLTAGARAQGPARSAHAQSVGIWTVPEVGALPRDASGLEIRKGRDLITATYAYIGPDVADASNRYAGNNLACSNCHLEAGTKKFGLPLFGLYSDFPQYSARAGGEISIEDRVNSCMRRSMNGRALPADAPEMQAIVAYIKFISSGVAPDQRLPGLGTGKMPELNRAAEPARGEPLYLRDCAACHNSQGSGERQGIPGADFGYVFPPLWGPSTFNDGAGMARIITLANFIHFNMPHGVDYLDVEISVDDAWDIAAYVLSHPRPHLAGLEHDFPDLLSKPLDTPYGPYADHFSELQHKYGPFQPIEAEIERLRREHSSHAR
jgi:thiosulfate dehydrogenase